MQFKAVDLTADWEIERGSRKSSSRVNSNIDGGTAVTQSFSSSPCDLCPLSLDPCLSPPPPKIYHRLKAIELTRSLPICFSFPLCVFNGFSKSSQAPRARFNGYIAEFSFLNSSSARRLELEADDGRSRMADHNVILRRARRRWQWWGRHRRWVWEEISVLEENEVLHFVWCALSKQNPMPTSLWEVLLHPRLLQSQRPCSSLHQRLLSNHTLQKVKFLFYSLLGLLSTYVKWGLCFFVCLNGWGWECC